MECDKDMGLINTKSQLNILSDWSDIFKPSRKNPAPINVLELRQDMVKNMTQFLKPFYKAGCPVPTRCLRGVFFFKNDPGTINHRDSWNGAFFQKAPLLQR